MFSSSTSKKEAYFLQVLWDGLERLYEEVSALEKARAETDAAQFTALGIRPLAYGSSCFGSGPNDTMITNDFVWYACSAACFLALFDHAFRPTDNYHTVFAEMLKWRDKVAAHTAYVWAITEHKDPSKIDSQPSQDASIMMSPDWDTDHYSVGGWIVGNGQTSSHSDWHWSLTRTHTQLREYLRRAMKVTGT